MRKNRNGLGRPALPEESRKSPLVCHLPNRVIDQLGAIAERRDMSRNKLVAQVLGDFITCHAAEVDRGMGEVGGLAAWGHDLVGAPAQREPGFAAAEGGQSHD